MENMDYGMDDGPAIWSSICNR